MKILFISNLYPPLYIGGYELNCFEVAQGLQARGHSVSVLTSSFRERELHDLEDGVYRLLKLKTDYGLALKETPSWLARNKALVQRHNTRATRSVIDGVAPDVIMVWGGLHLGRGVLTVCEEQTPVAYYLQDPWLAGLLALQRKEQKTPFVGKLRWLTLRLIGVRDRPIRADHLVFCSEALQTQYREMGVDIQQSKVIYLGVSTEAFAIQPQHILRRSQDEPFRILYSGQIALEKGTTTLVKALSKLRAVPGLEGTELGLMGRIRSQEYKHQLDTLIEELGLQTCVAFLQPRPRLEVAKVFPEYDVLAFTSEWAEPFGLSLVEAMSTGLPVVSSVEGGPAEIVRDGYNACAFLAGDPDDLADKLAYMLLHPETAAQMGLRAAQDARERFTIEREVQQVEAYLSSLLPIQK